MTQDSGMSAFEKQQQKIIHEMVKLVLTNYENFKWSLQGFGMFRTYLENGFRMTIWHEANRTANVSMVHTHPWDFTSYIACGMMRNQRYEEAPAKRPDSLAFIKSRIVAGEGGGLQDETSEVWLVPRPMENHFPRTFYCQKFDEIHASYPINGTVTLCDRTVTSPDGKDLAYVYWERGNQWISAEPKNVDKYIVGPAASCALDQLRSLETEF